MSKLIKTVQEIKSVLVDSPRPLGFVPTMGALHDGHVSLIKAAKSECKTTVVSIFVNPLQFGPNEDFDRYPRNLEMDMDVCNGNKVEYIFAPEYSEIYPDKGKDRIFPPTELVSDLCGKTRKNFFSGIATVVKKLFDLLEPDYAYFGEKDLQQLYVIKWLVKKYNIPVVIKPLPIAREQNGLACSSRNNYLSDKEKEIASNIYKSLVLGKENMRSGFFNVSKAILESLVYLSQFPEIKTEYFEARGKINLGKINDEKNIDFYFLIAAHVGNVRLIDNIEV